MGRDRGINNWLTCVSSGKPLSIDGHKVKSGNQHLNKERARIKAEHARHKLPQGFSSKRWQHLS
ncbi:MAG: hypothetical protein U7126_05475 [Microcoleus sp.]